MNPKPLALLLSLAVAACQEKPPEPAVLAEQKAVAYLVREVPAWRRENGCFSCHHNGDGARALLAASQRGYAIPGDTLRETLAWLAKPAGWDDNQGDPGFSDARLADVQFAATLADSPTPDQTALAQAAQRVAKGQAENGSWPIDELNAVGSPATYGARLATLQAVRVLRAADATAHALAIAKAESWLAAGKPSNVLAAVITLLAAGEGVAIPAARREEALALLRRGQSAEGGWGPYPDAPPEPFDTALALLALDQEPASQDQVQRGRGFLAKEQRADGSWPATTRPANGESFAQQVSTTAWATLALLRTRAALPGQ